MISNPVSSGDEVIFGLLTRQAADASFPSQVDLPVPTAPPFPMWAPPHVETVDASSRLANEDIRLTVPLVSVATRTDENFWVIGPLYKSLLELR